MEISFQGLGGVVERIGFEHPHILFLILPILLVFFMYIRRNGMSRRRAVFLFSRSIMVVVLVAALAYPYFTEVVEEFRDVASVVILSDCSGSMSVYGMDREYADSFYGDLSLRVGEATGYADAVELVYFSEGNRTEIGNSLYQEFVRGERSEELIVLISDGNNNYGRDAVDVSRVLGGANTSVYALVPAVESDDVYVSGVGGRRKTPVNVGYSMNIEVGKVGGDAEYNLYLRVDGEVEGKVIPVSQNTSTYERGIIINFTEAGVHEVVVDLISKGEDAIDINNAYMKTVDVTEKPKVLLVTGDSRSPLISVLGSNYDVTVESQYKESEGYDAVLLDNLNNSVLNRWVVNSLHAYVVDGNGLVVVGGDNAFENGAYRDSLVETLLPVISSDPPKEKRKPIAVLFVVDTSSSMDYCYSESGHNSCMPEIKAIMINVIRQLDEEDTVGVIAFNAASFHQIIIPLMQIGDNIEEIEDTISRLRVTDSGGTGYYKVLEAAESYISEIESEKYIIFMTDGYPAREEHRGMEKEKTINLAKSIAKKGINFYGVGVGGLNLVGMPLGDLTMGEPFLKEMVEETNGLYFRLTENQRLKATFEHKDEEEDEKEDKGYYKIGVFDPYHFITRNIPDFSTSIDRYNGVTEKSIAQVLITTEDNMPVVTVWRFGLGRVVAVTTDNGRDWASNIYSSGRGVLVSAVTNWAVGDLEKGKDVRINTEDVFLGEEARVSVVSEREPLLVMGDGKEVEELRLKQTDINEYSTFVGADDVGFYFLKAETVDDVDTDAIAVNYPREYSELGVDMATLRAIAELTDGRVYNESEVEQLKEDAVEFARRGSLKETVNKIPLQLYLMAAALLLFFVDTVIRRVRDVRRRRNMSEYMDIWIQEVEKR